MKDRSSKSRGCYVLAGLGLVLRWAPVSSRRRAMQAGMTVPSSSLSAPMLLLSAAVPRTAIRIVIRELLPWRTVIDGGHSLRYLILALVIDN